MIYRLNQEVVDKALELTGAKSEIQLAYGFLFISDGTLRNYLNGKTSPNLATLMRLKNITGIPLDRMTTEMVKAA